MSCFCFFFFHLKDVISVERNEYNNMIFDIINMNSLSIMSNAQNVFE